MEILSINQHTKTDHSDDFAIYQQIINDASSDTINSDNIKGMVGAVNPQFAITSSMKAASKKSSSSPTSQSGSVGDLVKKDDDLNPTTGKPNTWVDLRDSKGNVIGKRYYGPDGRVEKDEHFTDHGNPKTHPKVPHEHTWDWTDAKHPKPSKWF